MADNNEIVVQEEAPIQAVSKDIDIQIAELSDSLKSGTSTDIKQTLDRLNYLCKIKNSIRHAKLSESYDDVIRVLLDRFNNDYPTFTNKELLDYATQLQQIIETTRKACNDDISTIPILQTNTQININTQELDRASRERVADAVKAILKMEGQIIDAQDNN